MAFCLYSNVRFTSLLWRNIMIYYFRKSLDMSWFWPKVICASTYTRSLEEKAHMCPLNTFLRKKHYKFLLLTKITYDLRICYHDLYKSSLVHSLDYSEKLHNSCYLSKIKRSIDVQNDIKRKVKRIDPFFVFFLH